MSFFIVDDPFLINTQNSNGCIQSLNRTSGLDNYWTSGLDYTTGLVDWITTGLVDWTTIPYLQNIWAICADITQ